MLLLVFAFMNQPDPLDVAARLLPAHMRNQSEWITISEEEIAAGVEQVPTDVNIVFRLPSNLTTITRRTLFGRVGTQKKYWGMRFPRTPEEADELRKTGLPGYLFMSELQREYIEPRNEDIRYREARSIKQHLSDKEQRSHRGSGISFEHELDLFEGGDTFYLMVDGSDDVPMGMGLDADKDGVHIALEDFFAMNPNNPDTDGDKRKDGIEVFGEVPTDPTVRDTDQDGLMDGIEDANGNGRIDPGETDPTDPDTDKDGKCDGLCPASEDGDVLDGEDMNLNGKLDAGETDPLSKDTDNDGFRDKEEFYFCIIFGGTNCSSAS